MLCAVVVTVAGADTPSGKSGSSVFFGVSRMVGLINQANTRLQTSLQNNAASGAALKNMTSRNSQDVDRDGQVVVEMFENERLEGRLLPEDPKKFSDKDAAAGTGYDALPDGDLPSGYEWATEWEIDQNYTAVDRDGANCARGWT